MKKAGILGGGQLGRMLLQAAVNYPVETYLMENEENAPAAHLCHHFTKGDITRFEDVYDFGKHLDFLTIEIENVNLEALEKLSEEGVIVYPNPAALKIIKNKIQQKQFYVEHNIPTSAFVVTHSIEDLKNNAHLFPAVHKVSNGGYDGKGVQIIRNIEDCHKGFYTAAVLEKMVNIKQEIAIIIAVGNDGQIAIYPPVDMVFDQMLNLLSYQICPAEIPQSVFWKAEAIAINAVKNLKSPGLFAVEMFADNDGNVLINEIAPRVHNSGHHTIEGNYSSQFDMMWRIMLDYPLGNTAIIQSTALVNLIGEEGHSGDAIYFGMNEVLSMDNTFVHIYGKQKTKPGRKMGHITVISNEKQELLHKVNKIKNSLSVRSQTL
ncbi:MAG: 5-(carboxyamino)imidazole ribonucleotide synthase [Bacteroidota bacterium]